MMTHNKNMQTHHQNTSVPFDVSICLNKLSWYCKMTHPHMHLLMSCHYVYVSYVSSCGLARFDLAWAWLAQDEVCRGVNLDLV
jgi:hypothetical protein